MSNPRYLEYTSAAVPIIEHIKPQTISSNDEHFICSPNLQAGYIKLIKGVPLQDNFLEASSHIFYVLNGRGKTEIGTIRNTQKCPGKELALYLIQSFIYNFITIKKIGKHQSIRCKKINTNKIPQVINPCTINFYFFPI